MGSFTCPPGSSDIQVKHLFKNLLSIYGKRGGFPFMILTYVFLFSNKCVYQEATREAHSKVRYAVLSRSVMPNSLQPHGQRSLAG